MILPNLVFQSFKDLGRKPMYTVKKHLLQKKSHLCLCANRIRNLRKRNHYMKLLNSLDIYQADENYQLPDSYFSENVFLSRKKKQI